MGGMERIKRERNERQGDKTENHHQNRLYLSLFDIKKVGFFIKTALGLYSELCFLHRRGAHFHKIHEKTWPENEKWSRESLDGKWNEYVRGLDGAENRKC